MHNYDHLYERLIERLSGLSQEELAIVHKCYRGLITRIVKKRNMPNQDWFRPVKDQERVIAYICGVGCTIRTILTDDMEPYGKSV